LVKLDAALENFDEFLTWVKFMIPKDIITSWLTFLSSDTKLDSSEVKDGELAVGDHLVGDFCEESGHSLVGVVVSCDGVDHLDTVHQSWKCLFDCFWISIIEWLNELLESLEILNVILGFIQSFGNSKLNSSPS